MEHVVTKEKHVKTKRLKNQEGNENYSIKQAVREKELKWQKQEGKKRKKIHQEVQDPIDTEVGGHKRPREDIDEKARKRARFEEKQAKKGFLYTVKCRMNKLIDSTKEIDRPAVVSEILKELEDSEMTFLSFGIQPTGARILQAMLKHGSLEQRALIHSKYQEHLIELVQTKCGIALAQKIFRYCPKITNAKTLTNTEKEAQRKIFARLADPFLAEKTISKLFFHKLGCRFLDFLYSLDLMKNAMRQQIINTIALPKKISFLVEGIQMARAIGENIAVLTEQQKREVASHLADVCDNLVDKELLELPLVQRILKCYVDIELDETLQTFVQSRLPIDGVPHLLASKPGNDALVRFLGFVTSKQRKELVRHLKGKWADLAMNNVNYVFVMRFLTTIDDTVLATKSIIAELIEELPAMIKNNCGRKVIGVLLTPQDSAWRRRVVAPTEQSSLLLPAPTSLKNSETRRKELVASLLTAMEPMVGLEFAQHKKTAVDLIVAYFDNVPEDHPSRAAFMKDVSDAFKKDTPDDAVVTLLCGVIKSSVVLRNALWDVMQPHLEHLCSRMSKVVLAMLKAKPDVRETVARQGSLSKHLLDELNTVASA